LEKGINHIVIIGSGNIAWHLINALSKKGINILQVLARNEKTAKSLSKTFSVPYITDPVQLEKDGGLYIVAVQDDHIREVALGLHLEDQLLVHTSGFSSIEVLSGASARTGVIWPLQTLTAGKRTDYSHIPFFIEGNSKPVAGILTGFAGRITDRVLATDSPTRQKIHLAAVIASNLTNQLYSISASILERQDIPFDVLAPLILETAIKAGQQHPLLSQTGPAVRKDLRVIEKHLELLRHDMAFQDIYRLITENIIHHHASKK
jgi:predicted short-subunit dehydrogenase-like oxidoreductase (DUF2520 family)